MSTPPINTSHYHNFCNYDCNNFCNRLATPVNYFCNQDDSTFFDNFSSTIICKSRSLSILYYNARSLLPKFSELQLIAETYSPNIICITETWLSSDIQDQELFIPGYQLIRLDRNRHGGGVLMFITTHLSFSILPGCEDLELLSVVVRQESCKVCISLFYRPPNSLSFVLDSFQSYLESLAIHQYTNFIVLGDFIL